MAADPGAPHGGPPHHPYASQPHGQRTASRASVAKCVYRRPEENLRPDEVGPDPPPNTVAAQPRPPDDQDVISRLARIESLLQQATAAPDHRDRTGLAQFGHFREGEGVPGQVPTPPSSHNDLTAVRPVHPLRFNIGFDLSGLSRLSGHDCPRELAPLCASDTSERQLDLELARSKDIFDCDYVHHESLDLTMMRCARLQQVFCRDVLPWCPIFDQDDCAGVVSRAIDSQFRHRSLDSCLALYVLAIGAFANDPNRFYDDPARFPGVDYFRAACQIADAERLNANTVRYVQCQILQCFYLLYCLRPLLAHEAIQRASTKVVVLLQQHTRVEADPTFRQQCIRAYWTCYLLEHELQAYIPWSSQILQCFNEDMKLPLSQYDEPGFYWFLAEITLRRIFSRPRGDWGGTRCL
ncbi:unnamed protein product [Parascedosporium putredinis]|uniref:Transcription factor domain-containing protein n=1 Tax=Parascedosporium putredinis TaxID=1442378 RepID=A0A9P1H067_9PEZI|nr:unnamed protein product [Parascedosporium putredinis]CAI7991807.1 unnamed protein product [Parascedosporium putredinis]